MGIQERKIEIESIGISSFCFFLRNLKLKHQKLGIINEYDVLDVSIIRCLIKM